MNHFKERVKTLNIFMYLFKYMNLIHYKILIFIKIIKNSIKIKKKNIIIIINKYLFLILLFCCYYFY